MSGKYIKDLLFTVCDRVLKRVMFILFLKNICLTMPIGIISDERLSGTNMF